jgi:hypothetical protein
MPCVKRPHPSKQIQTPTPATRPELTEHSLEPRIWTLNPQRNVQGIGFEPQANFEAALEQKFPTSTGRDGLRHITGANTRDTSRRIDRSDGATAPKPVATLQSRFAKGTNDLDVRSDCLILIKSALYLWYYQRIIRQCAGH